MNKSIQISVAVVLGIITFFIWICFLCYASLFGITDLKFYLQRPPQEVITEEREYFEKLCRDYQKAAPSEYKKYIYDESSYIYPEPILENCQTLTDIRKIYTKESEGLTHKNLYVTIKNKDGSFAEANGLEYVFEDGVWKFYRVSYIDTFAD